jgi:amidase
LAHDPGGSSGGTAAAVAANLGVVGLGEDTGGSIRLPASFTNLVGVRVTPGLISRNGMQPLIAFQDTPGPMTRTVKDAAILLDAIVGYDPSDEFTAEAIFAAHHGSYVQALDADGLKGARLGVVRNAFGPNDRPESAAVNRVIESALKAAKSAGANVIDIEIPNLDERLDETAFYIAHSRYEVNKFLASRPNMRMNSLEAIHAAGKFDLTLDHLINVFAGPETPEGDPDYYRKLAGRDRFQRLVVGILAKNQLAAIAFPSVQVSPPTKKDVREGKHPCMSFPTNTAIAAHTGMPSICLPAGFSDDGLPVGMEFVAPRHHEPFLFRFGYAFEQATKHRRAPRFI